MSDQKSVVLWCHTDYSVLQEVRDLLSESGDWRAKELTTPIQTITVQNAQAMLAGCDAVCLFIPKTDLRAAQMLTGTMVAAARSANVPRIIWIAPVLYAEDDIGQTVIEAENVARKSGLPSLVIRHGILFSELLLHREEVRTSNTLSLPLNQQRLLWVSPQDVAARIVHGLQQDKLPEHPIVMGEAYTGEALASTLSQQLAANLQGERFVQRRFAAIDVNKDGKLERQELAPYMAELGYNPGESTLILNHADANNDDIIDFEEFIHDIGENTEQMLKGVPTDIRYLDIPDAAFLYDMGLQGMSEEAAKQYLRIFRQPQSQAARSDGSNREQRQANGTDQAAINLPTTSFESWVDKQILEFLNVYVLPGKGTLSIHDGHYANQKARIIRLVYPSGRTLIGRRTLTNTAVDFQWNDRGSDVTESLRYVENGDERILELQGKRLVGLRVKGNWPGLRWAIPILFSESELPDWQIDLFRQSGQLHVDTKIERAGSANDIICNCTGMSRGAISALIEAGADTVAAIAKRSQATNICGGCRPLVKEMLGDANWTSVHVSEVISVADHARTYRFTPDHKALRPGNPGQHIIVQSQIQGELVQRAYTISSAAGETGYREITVQRESQGLFSRWLFDEGWRDEEIRISDPQGGFFADLARSEPIVCLVGGIGMTPALAMCRSVIQAGTGQAVYVDFCDTSWDQMLYAKELRHLSATHDNIHVNLRVTSEHGRLNLADVRQIAQQYPDARYFICGPAAFQDAVERYLAEVAVPQERINVEEFTALRRASKRNTSRANDRTPPGSMQTAVMAADAEVSSTIEQTTVQTTVPAVLQAPVKEKSAEHLHAVEPAVGPSRGYIYVGLLLLLAFGAQDMLGLKWPWLETLQAGESYRRWSGLLLLLYMAGQFVLPAMRLRGDAATISRHHHLHKVQGALAPLIYYVHATAMGYAYLFFLSFIYFANFALGLLNQDLVSDPEKKQRYLYYWLAPHVGLSILTVTLVAYHIYVVFAYQ